MEKFFVIINKHKYEINADILMELLDEFSENPSDKDIRRALLNDMLRPKLTNKDNSMIRISKFAEIMERFGKAQDELQTEIKKKLSI